MHCRRFLVTGRVQGVAYRVTCKQQANKLHLVGYAKNLLNGSVEVQACGEDAQLDELKQWLAGGPSYAAVEGIVEEELQLTVYPHSFTVE